jgi:REase_DpnII-MboI
LIIDIERYQKIPDVRHLVCVVFDTEGALENPRGLEADLSRNEKGLSVIVMIVDR